MEVCPYSKKIKILSKRQSDRPEKGFSGFFVALRFIDFD